MIGLYNYSVLFTLCGTISGILSIYFSTQGNPFYGVLFLLVSGFFDMFDGCVARTRKNRDQFDINYGIELDSLSDVICFGASPVFLTLEVCQSLDIFRFLSLIYLITAISRLAYFNVEEQKRREKTSEKRKVYTGLPVTASSLILAIAYSCKKLIGDTFPIFFLIILLITSIFQVSKIKFPHLEWKGLLICLSLGIIVALLIIL